MELDSSNKTNDNIKLVKHNPALRYSVPHKNEIYISRKRHPKLNLQKFYFNRIDKLFNTLNYKEIYLYGLGACVNDAIRVALFTKETLPSINIKSITSDTIPLYDEYITTTTSERVSTSNTRKTNLIKIKLTKD
jgi:hypothetical protein